MQKIRERNILKKKCSSVKKYEAIEERNETHEEEKCLRPSEENLQSLSREIEGGLKYGSLCLRPSLVAGWKLRNRNRWPDLIIRIMAGYWKLYGVNNGQLRRSYTKCGWQAKMLAKRLKAAGWKRLESWLLCESAIPTVLAKMSLQIKSKAVSSFSKAKWLSWEKQMKWEKVSLKATNVWKYEMKWPKKRHNLRKSNIYDLQCHLTVTTKAKA